MKCIWWTNRAAFTLIELLIAISVIGILLGLLLPAVQKVRAMASQTACQVKMKQLALAITHYHDANHRLPPGHRSAKSRQGIPFTGWTISILPFAEQEEIFHQSHQDTLAINNPLEFTKHSVFSKVVSLFVCPNDYRITAPQISLKTNHLAAFTSYLGNAGLNYRSKDGTLFQDSQLNLPSITDGTSNTLLLGERPPSGDFQFGWWYAGAGQVGTGSGDLILGVQEQNIMPAVWQGPNCNPGFYSYQESQLDSPCNLYHYWSLHTGGANFAFSDGAVRFMPYSSRPVMPALASRNGNDGSDFME